MKTSIFNTIFIEELEGPDRGLPDSLLFSITVKTCIEGIVTTYSRPSLFVDCCGFNTFSSMPSIELKHDSTWDGFGRAYYSSSSYQFAGFHFTLYSVDELRWQIEAKMRQYEQNSIMSVPCVLMAEPHSSLLDRYFAENPWDEDLYALIEDFKARNVYARNLWVTDDHSCRPFDNTSIYLHQLAKLSLSVHNAPTSAASRPRCRSLLMASCRQLSGDDLLGH